MTTLTTTLQKLTTNSLKISGLALAVLLLANACTDAEGPETTSSQHSELTAGEVAAPTTEPVSVEVALVEPAVSVEVTEDDSTLSSESSTSSTVHVDADPTLEIEVSLTTCLSNDSSRVVLNFLNVDGVNFVGDWFQGEKVLRVEGRRLTSLEEPDATFEVAIFEEPNDSVTTQLWHAGHATLDIGDGTPLLADNCDDDADATQGDDDGILRSCFATDDTVAFLDHSMVTGEFTGAVRHPNNLVEAFAGRITDEQRGGVNAVLDVNTTALGSGEDGATIVNRQEWVFVDALDSDYALANGTMYAEFVDCSLIAERVAPLDDLVGVFPPVPI